MSDPMTLCLAHGLGEDTTCPKADQCKRHLALRDRMVSDGDDLIGTACATRDYALFVPPAEAS